MAFEFQQDIAAIAQRVGKVGPDRERPIIAGERLLIAFEFVQDIGSVKMRQSGLRIELQACLPQVFAEFRVFATQVIVPLGVFRNSKSLRTRQSVNPPVDSRATLKLIAARASIRSPRSPSAPDRFKWRKYAWGLKRIRAAAALIVSDELPRFL